MSTHIPSPEDLLFDRSISVLLLGFERFDRLAKVMSAFTRDIVILQKEKKKTRTNNWYKLLLLWKDRVVLIDHLIFRVKLSCCLC